MKYNRQDVLLKMHYESTPKGMHVGVNRYSIKMIHIPTGLELFLPVMALRDRSDIKNIEDAHEMLEYAVLCLRG